MKNKVNTKLEWIRNFFFDSRILLYYRSFFCKEDETGDTPEGENLN